MDSKADSEDICKTNKQKKKRNNSEVTETQRQRRRREKKESELKENLSLQKQAAFMFKFLESTKPSDPNDKKLSNTKNQALFDSAKLSMDATLHSGTDFSIDDIRKAHFSVWRDSSKSVRSKRKQRWGMRLKPKSELYKELKLARYGDLIVEENAERSLVDVKRYHVKQLFQFDHSPRPAFYGISGKKSQVVGPRHPFRKDPSLDYDVNSDEEWEEEDPGESLSGHDKDEEEECLTSDYEICGVYFVPDGYLSEDEGKHVDKMETIIDIGRAENLPKGKNDAERDEFCSLLQQQKNLNNLIKLALEKNKPLIITNLMHEMRLGQDSDTLKSEQIWLRILSWRVISAIDISVDHFQDKDQKHSCGGSVAPVFDDAILESNLPLVVAAIQSYPKSLNKVLKSLKQTFPSASKALLKDKVREISNYVDNCLQVKKEVLVKFGIDKGCSESESRSRTVYSSSCLPPTSDILKPASATPSAIIAPNHIHKCSSSSSMLSFHLPYKIKTKLPLFTKGSPTSRMLLPRVKVEPDDISIFHWPSVENALSNALHHLLSKLLESATTDNKTIISEVATSADNDDAKKISSEGVLATEEPISSFITHVASLVRLVDSRDIVELQLKKLDCEVTIRKKEAMSQPQAPTQVVMLNSPPPSPPVVG